MSAYSLVFSLLLALILSACGGKGVEPEPEPEPRANHEEGDLVIELPGGVKMAFMWIEPGAFMMGSPESESGRQVNEGPQHEVTLTKGFYMGKYEVTQQQWTAMMETQPWAEKSDSTGPEQPVFNISWREANDFLKELNVQSNTHVFRLPTEAEWEYACRAGTTTPWSFGDDVTLLREYAWYNLNAVVHPRPVGLKLPNPWGLYDMHGNVREYVNDWYNRYPSEPQIDPTGPDLPTPRPSSSDTPQVFYDDIRVIRDGSHAEVSGFTRCTFRIFRLASSPFPRTGFRAVAEVAQ